MARLVTHAEVSAVPDGGTLHLTPDDQLTPLAEERARARGVHLDRSAGAEGGGPADPALVQEVLRRVTARLGGAASQLSAALAGEVLQALGGADPQDPPRAADASFSDIDYCAGVLEGQRRRVRQRAIITTTGRNRRGIVARLTAVIAEQGGDVLDLSQTLVGDYFTMILVVDTSALAGTFAAFKAAIEDAVRELSLQALVMHEDIVTSLQRV